MPIAHFGLTHLCVIS